jgi:phosphatidylglycerol:prolipoprotein diacylglycerol transferase
MVAFSILWRDIYRYGIMYLVSFVTGYTVVFAIGKSNIFQSYPKIQQAITQDIDNLLIIIILGVMLWWRLGYVIIYDRYYFIQNPESILAIRQGGMSFIGGMIGVVSAILFRWRRKNRSKNDFLWVFDTILSIVPLGILLWRIGNFLNQEIYGILVPADYRWLPNTIIQRATNWNIFYIYETIDTQLRINTNFLAAFFEGFMLLLLCGGVMLYSIYKKKFHPSRVSALFIFSYGFVRFFLEYLRVDSQSEFIGRLTKSQYFFVLFMIIGIYFLLCYHPVKKAR